MHIFFFLILAIGYIILLIVTIYTLIYILRHQQIYGTKLTVVLNFSIIFNAVIFYSTLYFFSIIIYFSVYTNIILWKLSLISGFISLMLTSLFYTLLKEFKKISYFPFIIFNIFFGFLIGSLFSSNSIQVIIYSSTPPPFFLDDTSNINYRFNITTGLVTIIFQTSIAIYYFLVSITLYKKTRNKKNLKSLLFNTVIYSFPILLFILYIIFQLSIFRELHILVLWINLLGVCYMLLKKPETFLAMSNKIHFINIYHKSGILLYSYKFEINNKEIDSTIWGNILIGINHILSEFVDTKDQIEVLQTENSDIIVNYDDLGFAVVLITNHKNSLLQKLMNNFAQEFRLKYKNELTEIQDLNKLINVSEFNETKSIIERNFHMYLK